MKYLNIIFFVIVLNPLVTKAVIKIEGKTTVFEEGVIISIKSSYTYRPIETYDIIQDSSIVKNKKFQLLINSSTAEFFILSIHKRNGEKITTKIFLQPTNTLILLNDSTLKNIALYNNTAAKEYISFIQELEKVKIPELLDNLWRDYDAAKKNNSKNASIIFDEIHIIENRIAKENANISLYWVKKHPKSYLNTFIIYYFLRPQLDESTIEKIFFQLPNYLRKNSWGNELNYFFGNLVIGKKNLNFTQIDTSGSKISLLDFKGKYILLDFWASWCKPCRINHPYLKEIYNEFKSKNFTIISISLDNNRKAWVNGILQDSLSWCQLSDLKGWENMAAKKYGVQSIPSNYLLDIEGKIIKKDLSMPLLREILMQELK